MQHHRQSRRLALGALALAASLPFVSVSAFAQQNYPDKPIRLVVPFPAGGPTDTAARIIGQKMGETLKQTIVIDNRPGASGTIGTDTVAKAAPDGYTLVMLATPALLAAHLLPRRTYDVFKDFTPIGNAYELPIVMVVNPTALPDVTDLQQYIAKAKASPGKMNYTSAGNGSFGHLSTELLKNLGHFDVQHVPYKGSAPAISDLLAGQVPMMFSDMIAALPHIKAGKLRALAITSSKRSPILPDVPTMEELGYKGVTVYSWQALAAPKGLPADIKAKLHQAVVAAMNDPGVKPKLLEVGFEVVANTPEQFTAFQASEFARWKKVIQTGNITAD